MSRSSSIQLPAEHGSWTFLLLPTLAALALAPSAPGAWLTLSSLAAFLARMPLKRALKARRILKGDQFLLPAEVIVALAAMGLAFPGTTLAAFALLSMAILAGFSAMGLDLSGRSRTSGAEYLAISAPCLLGGAVLALGGGAWTQAWSLVAGAFVSLAAPVAYLRNLLRGQRGGAGASPMPMLLVHALAVLVAWGLYALGGMGWLWPAWMGALALRAAAEPLLFNRLPNVRWLGMREALICGVSAGALVFSLWRPPP